MRNPLRNLQDRVAAHHFQSFGRVPLARMACKVGEEAGEVLGAQVRDEENRDGRSWAPEVRSELGDLLVSMLALSSRYGFDFSHLAEEAVSRFEARKWEVPPKPLCQTCKGSGYYFDKECMGGSCPHSTDGGPSCPVRRCPECTP